MTANYVPPEHGVGAFNCPFCGAFAHQYWHTEPFVNVGTWLPVKPRVTFSECAKCDRWAVWYLENLLVPGNANAPMPASDMHDDVKKDYMEAREIANRSPRGAAALLRLALQRLMSHLGEKGKRIDDDIASLVKKGLPVRVQQALDAVRVIGNNAVHPGQMDLDDDPQTVNVLFTLLNVIVHTMITQPKEIDEVYNSLPAGNLEAIKKRDGG